jgi:N4-gp56 family major capsid protein
MANTTGFNSTAATALGGTAGDAGLVQKAYDRLIEFQLRAEPMLRAVADKRPSSLTNPGETVVLQKYKDLARKTSTLAETVDVDSVGLDTPDKVLVTLEEYGNATVTTRKLNLLSLADVDPAIANILAFNMADSIDEIVKDVLLGGTNVRFADGGVDATGTLTAADVRYVVAKLRANKAAFRKGSMYWSAIHPEVSHDLRAESDAAAWRAPHNYVDTGNIYAGEIGAFEGAFFVESARIEPDAEGVYPTFFAGQQALAEVVAEEPHMVVGPVTDKLMRLRPMGWYGVLGHAIYRDEALYRVESSSSIAEVV